MGRRPGTQNRNDPMARTWPMLIALAAVNFFASLDRFAFVLLIEPIKKEFNATDGQMGMLSGLAFVVCYIVFGIPLARMVDTGVRKTILIATLAVSSVVTMLTGLAGSALQLGLFRASLGAAEAGAVPASLSMLADLYPRARRHMAVSVFQCGAAATGLVGVPIIGLIGQHYGWRTAVFWMGLPGLVLALALIPIMREPSRGQFDTHDETGSTGQGLWQSLGAIGKNTALMLHIISHTLAASGSTIFMLWSSAHLSRSMNVGTAQAGIVYGLSSLLSFVGLLAGGWICNRLIRVRNDDRLILGFSAAMLLLAAGFFFAMLLMNSVIGYLVWFSIASFVFALRYGAALTLATDMVAPRMRGLSSSLLVGVSGLVGGGLAPVVSGMLSDSLVGMHGPAEGLRLSLIYTGVPIMALGGITAVLAMAFSPRRAGA